MRLGLIGGYLTTQAKKDSNGYPFLSGIVAALKKIGKRKMVFLLIVDGFIDGNTSQVLFV